MSGEGSPGAATGATEGHVFGGKNGGDFTRLGELVRAPTGAAGQQRAEGVWGARTQLPPAAPASCLPALLHGPFSDRPSPRGDKQATGRKDIHPGS